jgi:hypothetical protein
MSFQLSLYSIINFIDMEDFITAFNITMQTEGGSSPGVGGAETYIGVE